MLKNGKSVFDKDGNLQEQKVKQKKILKDYHDKMNGKRGLARGSSMGESDIMPASQTFDGQRNEPKRMEPLEFTKLKDDNPVEVKLARDRAQKDQQLKNYFE